MNLLIKGITGVMGRKIEKLALEDKYWNKVSSIDRENLSIDDNIDVIIDFSHQSALDGLLKVGLENKLPLVIGTTGYSQDQLDQIKEAAKSIPILYGTNMSLGMNLVFALVEEAARSLGDRVDIEIIESHHNRKKDAPSGSALSIVEAIERGLGQGRKHKHGRQGEDPREKGEIGIHALRAGNIVGYHEANFISDLEGIKISHEAFDRSVFAKGALEAAKFIIGKEPGLYSMKDIL